MIRFSCWHFYAHFFLHSNAKIFHLNYFIRRFWNAQSLSGFPGGFNLYKMQTNHTNVLDMIFKAFRWIICFDSSGAKIPNAFACLQVLFLFTRIVSNCDSQQDWSLTNKLEFANRQIPQPFTAWPHTAE